MKVRGLMYRLHAWQASAVKVICNFVASKCYELDTGDAHSRNRTVATWGFADFQYCLDAAGPCMPEYWARRGAFAATMYLRAYQKLAASACEAGVVNWKVRPKQHTLLHIARRMRQEKLNPRHQSCMLEEDFLGKLKRIGVKTHRSSTKLRIMERYMLQLSLRWKRRRETGNHSLA